MLSKTSGEMLADCRLQDRISWKKKVAGQRVGLKETAGVKVRNNTF